MAYQILGFSTSPITQQTVYSILCDTVADLPAATISGGGQSGPVVQGCTAKIIANGTTYIANSSGDWILQPMPGSGGGGSGDSYTREEIDDFLADKQDLLTFGTHTVQDSTDSLNSGAIWFSIWEQMLGLNTYPNLADGDDLNDFTTPGIYRCTNSSTASGILNMPSPAAQQAGGRLIVLNVGGTGRYIQMYISAGARYWLRSNISTGWQPWYEYAGIENFTNYAWGNYNVAESTGEVNPSTTRIGTEDYFAVSGNAVLTWSAWASSQPLQTFYLFYDSNQNYLGEVSGTGYIGWVDCGVPVKVPSQARYYRLCFRRSGNQTITPSQMIKCIRQIG